MSGEAGTFVGFALLLFVAWWGETDSRGYKWGYAIGVLVCLWAAASA